MVSAKGRGLLEKVGFFIMYIRPHYRSTFSSMILPNCYTTLCKNRSRTIGYNPPPPQSNTTLLILHKYICLFFLCQRIHGVLVSNRGAHQGLRKDFFKGVHFKCYLKKKKKKKCFICSDLFPSPYFYLNIFVSINGTWKVSKCVGEDTNSLKLTSNVSANEQSSKIENCMFFYSDAGHVPHFKIATLHIIIQQHCVQGQPFVHCFI